MQVLGRHPDGLDVQLVALTEALYKTVVINHNNGVLNSVIVTLYL